MLRMVRACDKCGSDISDSESANFHSLEPFRFDFCVRAHNHRGITFDSMKTEREYCKSCAEELAKALSRILEKNDLSL